MKLAAHLILLILIAALLGGCSTTSAVVDKNTMASHVTFLGARVSAAEGPLEAAALGALETGDYDACLKLADELLTDRHRVPWHEAKALWLLRLLDAEDPGPAPEIPLATTICGQPDPVIAPAPRTGSP